MTVVMAGWPTSIHCQSFPMLESGGRIFIEGTRSVEETSFVALEERGTLVPIERRVIIVT